MPSATTNRKPRATLSNEEALVHAHLPLVGYAVSEISGRIPRHVSRDDLTSAGMAGLAQAARAFDPERGITFSRFAGVRIRGAILDELRSRDWASRSVRAKARRVSSASDGLTAELGRTPTREEVAVAAGMATKEVTAVRDDVHRAVVLNLEGMPVDGSIEEILLVGDESPEHVLLDRERRSYLVAAVANLPERLRRVVIGYFLEDLPMQTLADELGVTDSRISQMRGEALALLRDAINAQLDPDLVKTPAAEKPRVTKRRAAYHAAVGAHHEGRARVTEAAACLAALA